MRLAITSSPNGTIGGQWPLLLVLGPKKSMEISPVGEDCATGGGRAAATERKRNEHKAGPFWDIPEPSFGRTQRLVHDVLSGRSFGLSAATGTAMHALQR